MKTTTGSKGIHCACLQANHASYVRDTQAYLGQLLDHDDSDQARGGGTKLGNGFQHTCALWQHAFSTPYLADGTSYRQSLPLQLTSRSHYSPTHSECRLHGNAA